MAFPLLDMVQAERKPVKEILAKRTVDNRECVWPMLADLHRRLAGVIIECLGYSDLITRDDGSGTFFDLDPPCRGCKDAMVIREDFARPAQQRRV